MFLPRSLGRPRPERPLSERARERGKEKSFEAVGTCFVEDRFYAPAFVLRFISLAAFDFGHLETWCAPTEKTRSLSNWLVVARLFREDEKREDLVCILIRGLRIIGKHRGVNTCIWLAQCCDNIEGK